MEIDPSLFVFIFFSTFEIVDNQSRDCFSASFFSAFLNVNIFVGVAQRLSTE